MPTNPSSALPLLGPSSSEGRPAVGPPPAVGTPPAPLAAARHLAGSTANEVLAVAAQAAGATLHEVHLRAVYQRGERSRSHVYDAVLEVDGARLDVVLVAHVQSAALPAETFTVAVGDGQIAVWRFPHDPFLPGLPSALHPERVRELLERLAGPPGRVRLRTRVYRPSRRAVVEVAVDHAQAAGAADGVSRATSRVLYLKVLAGDRAAELAEVHRQLAGSLPTPRVIGVAADQGILALEPRAGLTLRQALLTEAPLPDAADVVELTARFAASGLRSRRDPRRYADASRHVAPLSALVPDLAGQIAEIATASRKLDGELVPVHGDLHDGQLLLTDGRITGLLDVDGAGPGLVAEDAGRLIAHLGAVAETYPESSRRAWELAESLTEAFARQVGWRPVHLAAAAAWLGLATGPHRAQVPDWETATRRRIARAGEALAAGSQP